MHSSKTVAAVAVAVAAASLTLNVVQYLQNAELAAAARAPSSPPPVVSATPAEAGRAGSWAAAVPDVPIPPAEPATLAPSSPLVPSSPAPVARAAPAGGAGPTGAAPMQAIAKMMKDPAMREMMRGQQKGMMDVTHASLFRYLDLSPEELETFKTLLLDKQMALVDVGIGFMDTSATAGEREARARELEQLNKDFDARIRDALGDEDFAVYQEFEATQPERMQVNTFKMSLSGDQALDEEKEHLLVRALYDERTNMTFSLSMDQRRPPDPSQFTAETIAKFLEEGRALQDRSVQRAAQVLTPQQLDSFKRSLEQQRAMQEMGLKMAAQMFGAPADNAAGATTR